MTVAGGTIPALVTPFTRGGADVDLDLLDAHVAWLHRQGVACVAPLGTNGEGPSMSLAERRRVIERIAGHPSGIALLPGTGCSSLPETIELSRFAVEHGAIGILVAPPWYFEAERDGLTRYYDALLRGLPDAARVFLYNVPAYTGVPVDAAVAAELRERFGERLAGVKDSSGDVEHSRGYLRAAPGLTLLFGSDAGVADAFRGGAGGIISALANAIPREVEAVQRAVAAGASGEQEQRVLAEVRALTRSGPRRSALKALVAAASGLPRGAVRPPLAELTDEEAARLGDRFAELGMEPAGASGAQL
jgi:4-hydroxy-tetrahydrodipicolinate synthase